MQLKNIKSKYRVIAIILILMPLMWLIVRPSKVEVSHNLIIDKELKLGETLYNIERRYELFRESGYWWSEKMLDKKVIASYENDFGIKIMCDRCCYYVFKDKDFSIRFLNRLEIFGISLDIIADELYFKRFCDFMLDEAKILYGIYQELNIEEHKVTYSWKFNNHTYLLCFDYNPRFTENANQRKIYMEWVKK